MASDPRPSRRRRVGVVAVLALALTAAACGGDDGGSGADDTTSATEAPATTAAGTDSTPPDSGAEPTTTMAEMMPVSGGELRVGLNGDAITLDPAGVINHAPSRTLAMAIYDPLFNIVGGGEVEPYLAEGLDVSDDSTVFTVTLRDGVMFHDGTPLDSAAVKAQFERMQDPALGSPAYANVSRIISIDTPDDLTVVFTVDVPWPAFPTVVLADHPGLMASPAALEQYGPDYSSHAVGTGPFRLVKYAPGDEYVVERNADYWQDGLPYLDRIVYRGIPDAQTRFQSLQAGDVDIIQSLDAGLAKQAEDAGLGSQVNLGIGSTEVVLNTERLTDPEVRRGLALAVDRAAINDIVNDGASEPAIGPLEPGSPFYGELEFPQFDQAAARELLQGKNVSVDLLTTPDAGTTRTAELLQQMWTAVGVNVTLVPLEQGQILSRTQDGDFDATLYVGQEVYDPDGLSLRYTTDAGGNNSLYSNPDVDAAFEQARSESDPAARTALYQGILDQIAQDAPVIYLMRKVGVFAYSSNVMNVPAHEPVGVQVFRPTEMWLEQ